MPIGKSKISDMDFGSFENSIDKNIETDKASDKFDQQTFKPTRMLAIA